MFTELIVGIASGGGVAVLSGFTGNIMGFARGRAERNIVGLFTTGQSDALWCLCEHALSFHGKEGGRCHSVRTTQDGRTPLHDHYGAEVLCRCQGFVGDPARNPAPVITRKDGLDLG